MPGLDLFRQFRRRENLMLGGGLMPESTVIAARLVFRFRPGMAK